MFFLHVSRDDPLGCGVYSAQWGQQQMPDCKLPQVDSTAVYPQEWGAVYGSSVTLGKAYECISTWCHVTGALVVQFVLILCCKLSFVVLSGRSHC